MTRVADFAGARGDATEVLGTRRPNDLVKAIEDAMVADGYPARDLADSNVRWRTAALFQRNTLFRWSGIWCATVDPPTLCDVAAVVNYD